MNITKNVLKTFLLAGSLVWTFESAYAEHGQEMLRLAQAQTSQGDTDSSSANNTSRQDSLPGAATDSAGQSGSTGASGASGAQESTSGQSGAGGTSAAGKSQTGSAKKQPFVHPPVYLLMPVETAATEPAMKQGCWARIHDRENYSGDTLTLVGPISLADMSVSGPFGMNWDDRVNSIEVGPKATVIVYDNENYRDQVAQFKSGQRVADLSKRMGFFDEFASIRVDCQKG